MFGTFNGSIRKAKTWKSTTDTPVFLYNSKINIFSHILNMPLKKIFKFDILFNIIENKYTKKLKQDKKKTNKSQCNLIYFSKY